MGRVDGHRPRIRLRLTAIYATTLLVVLLISAAMLRFAMRDALARGLDDSARASAALVSQFFRVEVAEYQTIDATLAHMAGELVFEDRTMHIHRPDGSEFTVVGWPPPSRAPVVLPPVRRLTVPLEPALAPGWMILVEASGAGVAAVEARIDRWLALGIPGFVLLAAAIGWWLTGRSLRPVGQMADAAAKIVPGTNGRIPVVDSTDELGRMGTRFNALLDRLDGALDQQRRFLADAAHELRTPLARVRSRVEVAMLAPSAEPHGLANGVSPNGVAPNVDSRNVDSRNGDSRNGVSRNGVSRNGVSRNGVSPHTAAALSAVHEEVVRMSTLVDELLQLARADAGGDGAGSALSPLFLDDLVADELHRWHVDAERATITLRCTVLQETPIIGDAVLLRRLIGVLLDNAIRYGRRGGCIDVRVATDGGDASLIVEDDGIGIAPEETARLAERFFRGERARAHRSDGSGLGLAIATWIVQRHGGAISFEPGSRGVGTRVCVRMPTASAMR
jgi:signal transduction histidine kinase